jgi:hypothetical protein
MEEIHCVLCRIDVSGTASTIKQLVEHHSDLRQGVKRLQQEVKVANFTAKVEVRNTIGN